MLRFYSLPTDKNRVAVVGECKDGVLKVAVARCSKKDSFIRKKGRAIAEGRLLKGKLHSSYPMDTCDYTNFIEIAGKIVNEVKASKKTH